MGGGVSSSWDPQSTKWSRLLLVHLHPWAASGTEPSKWIRLVQSVMRACHSWFLIKSLKAKIQNRENRENHTNFSRTLWHSHVANSPCQPCPLELLACLGMQGRWHLLLVCVGNRKLQDPKAWAAGSFLLLSHLLGLGLLRVTDVTSSKWN